ncbi:flavodoxin domain-containing protein [Sporolactobacillus kofuensis]|uniref:Flavodoxin domain-containing protein n=1 Tax=Sporolactobacillus kofuensis TaxID=269672 RepID=A0ABW1WDP8_9BACL|nr:flavodoxin domain-containing protein [Sporolactobacillus kofuensis]MCO7174969.1 flavodoxin domain-containing protein [Sporolactobacillus kofuensis]
MSNVVVVYQTRHGATLKYAKWISEALHSDLYHLSDVHANILEKYTTIIYGGALYASGIMGSKKISNYFSGVHDKNLIVFTVGLSNPKTTDYQEIINKNFNDQLQQAISFFHFRGAIDYKKLNIIHRIMMFALKSKIKKSKNASPETSLFLETYGKQIDFTEKESINPLIIHAQHFI